MPGVTLTSGVVRDGDAREVLEVEGVEHVLGVRVDLDEVLVDGRHLGHEVHAPFALLLLQLERDAAHGPPRDALHEVRDEAGDLVAHALRGHDGHLVRDPLVRVEVDAQARVVLLDDDAGTPLDGLRADAHGGSGPLLRKKPTGKPVRRQIARNKIGNIAASSTMMRALRLTVFVRTPMAAPDLRDVALHACFCAWGGGWGPLRAVRRASRPSSGGRRRRGSFERASVMSGGVKRAVGRVLKRSFDAPRHRAARQETALAGGDLSVSLGSSANSFDCGIDAREFDAGGDLY
eukprot:CAMPEP_0119295800 /NCGR_PEP_ID=MMETSP1329-20130426/50247_1 /TAXON_ID=114041 /ORGANISM="Genus nov. species nov., Strain RCC1024" /LENGTH=290 /DNA_ID=CAMNT_0007296721 /DNA_START=17 /DNA_END=888 /DNA_ORIENTATION=+